jgi:phosphoribosylformylglycinamidine cyclo-ligase
MLYRASIQTYDNRPGLVRDVGGGFSGFKTIPLANLPNPLDLEDLFGFDGVGTKVEIAERLQDYTTVAYDLLAMVCDDGVVRGGEPVAVGSVLDVSQLKYTGDEEATERVRDGIVQLATGYINAAAEAGVVIINGETAELGGRVKGWDEIKGLNFNWAAAVKSYVHNKRALTGDLLQEGQIIVGLQETGFRSNGITDVRAALEAKHGPDWHSVVVPELGEETLGQLVLRPSKIYSQIITALTGGMNYDNPSLANVFGVAHVTGGGQQGKIGRMLKGTGLGAIIDNPIGPPQAMLYTQEAAKMSDEKAHTRWHMGPGMVVVTDEAGVSVVEEEAAKRGVVAKEIGRTTSSGLVVIRNTGYYRDQSNEWLTYPIGA